MSAALIGSGVGLSLGAAYLAGGMAHHAADHHRAQRIAEAAAGGYSDALLQDANVLRLAEQPGQAAQARQLAQLTERLENNRGEGKVSAQRELECLAQAVYYEARGESPRGQLAVAQVVMNRVKHPAFPKTVCEVVFQGAGRRTGCQFSFACDGSMRGGREASAWRRAHKVAARVLAGAAIPDVGAATHFHTTSVAPSWGPQMRQVAQVGMHVFYKVSPRKAVRPASQPALQSAVLTSSPQPSSMELRLTNAVTVVSPAPEPAPAASADAAASPASAEAKPVQPAVQKPTPQKPAVQKPADSAALAPAATDAASS